jgi:preprotein translocase subunit YajC
VSGLLIIIVLFALLWFVLIRPQRARAQAQQRSLSDVAVGDEILTVGGIYGIVQELEPEEEGGDLVVEIAEGIHVRVSRKGLAMVVKPDEDEDDEDDDAEEDETDETDETEAGEAAEASIPVADGPERVEEVNGEKETVNPGVAGETAPSDRS